jgi:hypothetical protein
LTGIFWYEQKKKVKNLEIKNPWNSATNVRNKEYTQQWIKKIKQVTIKNRIISPF